ncbi:MAG: HEAT repeat domain-containing protein [Phycisphaerae bacterium]|nr:HEAT repeat domain-containing protein [Phycisphaerae bacterium]
MQSRPVALLLLAVLFASPAVSFDGGRPAHDADDDDCGGPARVFSAAQPASKSRAGHYDESTGRSLFEYPPHRPADFTHMKLELDIPDMNTPSLAAVQTLALSPVSRPLGSLTLRAGSDMSIKSVTCADRACSFTHKDGALTIDFDPPLPPGAPAEIVTSYTLTDPPEGLNWLLESEAWKGRPAQIHTQGESESNHFWFPCHDYPNDRLTTEIVATVPSGYVVSSNGRLVSRVRLGERETFHWLQDKPHVNYLVSLIVGKFDIVDVGTSSLPMPVYVPPGKGSLVGQTYGRTPEMVAHFEKLTGQPYPWDRYAQLVVWNFGAGGMENTSATSLYDTAVLDSTALLDGDLDGLISHELAHQWYGDLITCNSWDHIWLNEGFATYFTHLWNEHRHGLAEYQAGLFGTFNSLSNSDRADAPFTPGMTSKEGGSGGAFGRRANPYPKGASILHMLRQKLGDEAFFGGLRLYTKRHRLQTVETADLRKAMEEVSGLSLERFFTQWCTRPGTPKLEITLSWIEEARALEVNLKQTQTIDGYNPAYAFDLPLWVRTRASGSAGRTLMLTVDAKTATGRFPLDAEPDIAAVDPYLAVLSAPKITQPLVRWVAQADAGPTPASRLQAVAALARNDRSSTPSSAIAALSRIAGNDAEHHSLRAAAINALRDQRELGPLTALAASPPRDARIRRALASALSDAARWDSTQPDARDRIGNSLVRWARQDASYGVRAESIRSLAEIKSPEALDVALAAADVESQNDQIRIAALDALEMLNDPRGLDKAVRYARPGAYNRTRPVAIAAVAALAPHGKDVALQCLVECAADREDRARSAAARALSRVNDPRAVPALEELVARSRGRERQRAEVLLNQLREKAAKQG